MSDQTIRDTTHAVFRFVVDVDGTPYGAFTECTLPTIEWEIEEVKEGGLNTFTHQLPGRRKGAKIILKNGVGASDLVDWYIDTMSEQFTRRPLTISLLDSQKNTVLSWHIADAYPVKWTGPQLKKQRKQRRHPDIGTGLRRDYGECVSSDWRVETGD